jgi:hypothetical protein
MIQLQDRLKGLSQDQLVQEMQMPTGQVPQFLVLSELTRRKKMEDSFAMEQGRDQSTVAQDAIAAAGMPAGFAGQMAGAMAPQTDMAGNTGAMPQQMAPMPEQMPQQMPVQGMAGGGIVALQEGGQIVVRDGRRFVVQPDGTLLSEDGSRRVMTPGQNIARDVGRLREAIGRPEEEFQENFDFLGTPSLADVPRPYVAPLAYTGEDQLFREGSPTIPRAADAPPTIIPPASAAPKGTVRDVEPPAAPVAAPAPASGERTPLVDPNASTFTGEDQMFTGESPLAPRPQPAPAPISPGVEPGGLFSTILRTPKLTEDAERMLANEEISQAEYDALTRGSTRAANEVLLRRARGEEMPVDFAARAPAPLTPPDADGVPAMPELDPTPEAIRSAEEAAALRNEAGITTSLKTPEEVAAAAAAARAAVETERPKPPAPPGGGGIAAIAAQGAGAPTDFQQELMNMLEAREKRAEQDKWLALAQAGMALMSSKDPTFGGALGEAGQAGLGALRESRTTSEADRLGLLSAIEQSRLGEAQLELQRQAMAARGAARGGGGGGDARTGGIDTDTQRSLTFLGQMIDRVDMAESMGQMDPLRAKALRDGYTTQMQQLYSDASGLPPVSNESGPEYVN